MKTYRIYGLVCPITNKIKYIGYTSLSLDDRLRNHMRDLSDKRWKTHKVNWLKLLKSKGLKPSIILLHDNIISVEDACYLEIKYIKEYKENGYDLTNSTDGGEISKTFNPEIVQKIKDGLKKYYETHDGWNKGIYGVYHFSDESKKKLSDKNKGEKNPMYGKSILDIWIKKFGEETANKMFEDWKERCIKHDYDKLYDMYINKKMMQKDISEKLNLSAGCVSRLLIKYKLNDNPKKQTNIKYSEDDVKYILDEINKSVKNDTHVNIDFLSKKLNRNKKCISTKIFEIRKEYNLHEAKKYHPVMYGENNPRSIKIKITNIENNEIKIFINKKETLKFLNIKAYGTIDNYIKYKKIFKKIYLIECI